MALALLALGSNLGNRAAQLSASVAQLDAETGVRVVACSAWIETQPVGGPSGQPPFLNGAVVLETSLAPQALLALLQSIENRLGRRRDVPWGPRTVDLDLLLYDEQVIQSPHLVVPHPWMAVRRFVLEPAQQVAPLWRHPQIGWSLAELWDHLCHATNYLAITGPPGARLTSVAAAVVRQTDALLIATPCDDQTPLAGAASPHAGGELQCAAARARLLDRQSWPAIDRWAVSDFWFEQLPVLAEPWLDGPRRDALCRRLDEIRPRIVPPKLLIVLDAPPEWLSRCLAAGSRPPDNAWSQERLAGVRQRLHELARRPGQGPVLFLPADDAHVASTIASAMAAMT